MVKGKFDRAKSIEINIVVKSIFLGERQGEREKEQITVISKTYEI